MLSPINDRQIQPVEFLHRAYEVQANLPFCFSCGQRKGYCKCTKGPMNQDE